MNKPRLRTGFTTGTCAAAAVRGAASLLFWGVRLPLIPVTLPGGREVALPPHRLRKTRPGSFCSVVKDAGDDPDVTDGAVITASLSRLSKPVIQIEGGRGVGMVTRKGLQIPVGEAAINPTPRKMIENTLQPYLPAGEGVRVVIAVRDGEILARSTFNPKLGIVGGISILGTTGIVEPKSTDALKTSLLCALNIAHAENHTILILVPGHVGERGIKRHVKNIPVVQMSNFVGFMLKKCREKGFEKVILAGHPGKLAKIIRGDFDTHSARSASAIPLVMEHIHHMGLKLQTHQPNTIEEILQNLDKPETLFSPLAAEISRAAEDYSGLKTGVILLGMNGNVAGSYLPHGMESCFV